MVVRLVGTNEVEGRKILEAAGISAYRDPQEAAQAVVALAASPSGQSGRVRK
jgi:succinyl-CoA synthetase beta subunit